MSASPPVSGDARNFESESFYLSPPDLGEAYKGRKKKFATCGQRFGRPARGIPPAAYEGWFRIECDTVVMTNATGQPVVLDGRRVTHKLSDRDPWQVAQRLTKFIRSKTSRESDQRADPHAAKRPGLAH